MPYSVSQLQQLARAAAKRAGIPADGYVAQIGAESDWDPNATSPRGAMGLAQFMPATWAEWGTGNAYDPEASLDAGARYMAWVRSWLEDNTADASWSATLAAYNWGIGNVAAVQASAGADWLAQCPAATRSYVAQLAPFYESSSAPVVVAVVVAVLAAWALA